MKASKAIMVNATLTQKISEAVAEALNAGLNKDEVAAVLDQIKTILDNSDD